MGSLLTLVSVHHSLVAFLEAFATRVDDADHAGLSLKNPLKSNDLQVDGFTCTGKNPLKRAVCSVFPSSSVTA